jgi:hypothetical protein
MLKLFMALVGCKPQGRHTEQHDVFFGIADSIAELLPVIGSWWPEVKNKFHLDAWREVNYVDGYSVQVVENDDQVGRGIARLFFINLGGYKAGEFEEYHYKMLTAAPDKNRAIRAAKQTSFYRHTGFKTAPSHIDDKYGIDVDDMYEIKDILPSLQQATYRIRLDAAGPGHSEDPLHLGYFPIHSFKQARSVLNKGNNNNE